MAGIRRPPKAPTKAPPKKFVPLHQQILGKSQTELDTIEDLRYRLEIIYDRDEIDYQQYLDCHEALDVREAKAKEGLLKATGRYVKPEKMVDIKVKAVRQSPPKELTARQVKLIMIVILLVLIKIW